MDRFGLSALEMLSLLGPMIIVPLLLWFLVIGPLVLYPIARWRANREAYPDPQLGIKVALHNFKTLAFQVLLLGGAMLLFSIISKSNRDKGDLYRMAFGFLLPGGIVFAAHAMLLRRTNDELVAGVRRLFSGFNLMITGLVAFIALVMGFQLLLAKGNAGDSGRLVLAAVLVYTGAWVGLGMSFARLVLGDPTASAGPPSYPSYPMPPGATGLPASAAAPSPPAPVAASGGPSLPSLGAGAFPPIEPKS